MEQFIQFLDTSVSVHQIIGYLGSFLLAWGGLPELFRTVRNKRCDVGSGMLGMWFGGEVLLLLYILPKMDIPLLLNYAANVIIIAVMIFYKVFNRK